MLIDNVDQLVSDGLKGSVPALSVYRELNALKKRIEVAAKALLDSALSEAEDLAKSAATSKKSGMTVLDDDGVIVEPAVYIEGSTTLFITLPKL